MEISETKECSSCHETKPIEEFRKDSKLKNGRRNSCKKCESLRIKELKEARKNRTSEEIIIPAQKFCSKCKKTKSSDCFRTDLTAKNGLYLYCISCEQERHRNYRLKNNERSISEIKIPDKKRCGSCKEVKPKECFGIDLAKAHGLRDYCKPCDVKQTQKLISKYRERTIDEIEIPDEKICPKCNELLPNFCFSKNKTCKSGLDSWCKICNMKRYHELQDYKTNIKESIGCEICGEQDPDKLSWDHISDKNYEISGVSSKRKFDEETKLCRVLCFNCHQSVNDI